MAQTTEEDEAEEQEADAEEKATQPAAAAEPRTEVHFDSPIPESDMNHLLTTWAARRGYKDLAQAAGRLTAYMKNLLPTPSEEANDLVKEYDAVAKIVNDLPDSPIKRAIKTDVGARSIARLNRVYNRDADPDERGMSRMERTTERMMEMWMPMIMGPQLIRMMNNVYGDNNGGDAGGKMNPETEKLRAEVETLKRRDEEREREKREKERMKEYLEPIQDIGKRISHLEQTVTAGAASKTKTSDSEVLNEIRQVRSEVSSLREAKLKTEFEGRLTSMESKLLAEQRDFWKQEATTTKTGTAQDSNTAIRLEEMRQTHDKDMLKLTAEVQERNARTDFFKDGLKKLGEGIADGLKDASKEKKGDLAKLQTTTQTMPCPKCGANIEVTPGAIVQCSGCRRQFDVKVKAE